MMRNRMGEFIAAAAGPIERPQSALHAEFIAARRATLLARSQRPEEVKINFEGDASLVLDTMKGQGTDSSVFGPTINDLTCFLVSWASSEISHIQREGNSAAHRLVRMGISSDQEVLWFEEPPDLIQDILFEEGL